MGSLGRESLCVTLTAVTLYDRYTTVDCRTVRIFCVFKYARAFKQKVWNEADNRERDWGETLKFFFLSPHTPYACEARARSARKTITPRFSDFFTDFEKKKPTVLQSIDG